MNIKEIYIYVVQIKREFLPFAFALDDLRIVFLLHLPSRLLVSDLWSSVESRRSLCDIASSE